MIERHRLAQLMVLTVALTALPAIAQDVDEAAMGEAVERKNAN